MVTDWRERLRLVLEPLPDETGGLAIVLATAGNPPALAMLSSGDVLVADERVRVCVWASSSTVSRLGGAFSFLVPADTQAIRVEVVEATATQFDEVALIEGRLHDIRPTAEPPWIPELSFRPSNPGAVAIPTHLQYWAEVREWLEGMRASPPSPPQ